jgi:hypothetical protein
MLIRRFWDGKKLRGGGLPMGFPVGWVEFHETHHLPGFMVGLAGLDPPYGLSWGVEALQAAPTVLPAGFVEKSHQTALRLGSTRRTGR